jgi:nitroreductase
MVGHMASAAGARQPEFLIEIRGPLIADPPATLYLARVEVALPMDRAFVNTVPAAPEFGEPAPITASPETLAFLARRRSAAALTLEAPAPSSAELETLLRLATRIPDHGKLSPWRFVILAGETKARFVAGLEAIARERADGERLIAKLGKIRNPPLTVAVISSPKLAADIPEWEQRLSSAAVCMTLIVAAQAMGYGANWITDWYAYDAEANAWLGLGPEERVAGFVHLGSSRETPLERVRPDVAALASAWTEPVRPPAGAARPHAAGASGTRRL